MRGTHEGHRFRGREDFASMREPRKFAERSRRYVDSKGLLFGAVGIPELRLALPVLDVWS